MTDQENKKVLEYVIDSASRDKSAYPSPCKFKYNLPEFNSTVSKIEITGIVMSRSETNVNTSNNIIPFNIEDYITSVNIKNRGYGYTPGSYLSSDGYIDISDPGIFSDGTNCSVNLIFENGILDHVDVVNTGTRLYNGRFQKEIRREDVSAEFGNTNAIIELVVENNILIEGVVVNPGSNWTFGVLDYATKQYNPELLYTRKGRKAVIRVNVGASTSIESIDIVERGSGYVRGSYSGYRTGCVAILKIPKQTDVVVTEGDIECIVGTMRLGVLRQGQYDVAAEHDGLPGLCREITRALQKASSVSEFPYSHLDENNIPITYGSCSVVSSNPNTTASKKIVIRKGETTLTAGNTSFMELLFGTYTENNSVSSLIGFGSNDSLCNLTTDYKMYRKEYILPNTTKSFYFSDIGMIGTTLFNLNDTPNYVIIKFYGVEGFKKIYSTNEYINGSTFISVFKTGIDNVYTSIKDSQTLIMDIIGSREVNIFPAVKMGFFDIEILKPNGDLYGTTRDIIITLNVTVNI